MSIYQCATCRREVVYDGPLPVRYPFCSSRCQFVDLGKWLREQYTIERDLTPEEAGELLRLRPEAEEPQRR